jgi:8-oxo-dGTP pyrophosphatase MutT (NUDIX family)
MAREERSAGFVAFHAPIHPPGAHASDIASIHYLLLDHGRHWSFPKGHIEKGEDELEAAIRELREETGITGPQVIRGFRHEIHYFFRHRSRGLVRKTVTYFLARVQDRKLTLSREHVAAEFLPFERAASQVTFPSDREVLRQAHAHLANGPYATNQTPT